MKHTPGPWSIMKHEPHGPEASVGTSLYHEMYWVGYEGTDGRGHGQIAVVDSNPNAEANAQLIAAAPDLLMACLIMRESLMNLRPPKEGIKLMEKAIEKATGE